MPIEFKNLFYTYYPSTNYEHKALKNINLKIDDHDFIAIIGHTGSGKSTLVQQINALLTPTEGQIIVNNIIIDNKTKISGIKSLRKSAGMVFQFPEYQLFEETIFKDIAFGPKNFGEKEENLKDKVINLLKIVGLDETFLEKSPFEISGGQKRRVAIAGILALEPDYLILDEPTAGLDPKGTNEILDLFNKLHSQGKTIILVTHDMNQVLKYANKAVVLNDGEVVLVDQPKNIFKDKDNCHKLNIDVPYCFDYALKLIKKGLKINIDNIKDEETLINEIIRVKGNK